jgi:hypothetical protein
MNRIITTLVQLMLVGGCIAVMRLMWQDLKHDIAEMKKDLRK